MFAPERSSNRAVIVAAVVGTTLVVDVVCAAPVIDEAVEGVEADESGSAVVHAANNTVNAAPRTSRRDLPMLLTTSLAHDEFRLHRRKLQRHT
jgi:hypothetical protein